MGYRFLVFLVFTLTLGSCDRQTETPKLTAKTILNKAIEAHGGQRYDGATITFDLNDYRFKFHKSGYNYKHQMSSEKDGAYHTATAFNGGMNYRIEDSLVEQNARLQTMIRTRVNNVAYDFYIPYVFTTNDIVLTDLGTEQLRLRNYHKIKVGYKQIEGAEPDLRAYVLWIDTETFEIDFIAKQNDEESGRKQFMAAAYKRKVEGMLFSDFELYQTYGRNLQVPIDSLGIAYNIGNMQRRATTKYENIEVDLGSED